MYKGAGLGLYTVSRYIEAMDGNIRVESELGAESKFIITLPVMVSDHVDKTLDTSSYPAKLISSTQEINQLKEYESPSISKDKALSVLVVEDNKLASHAIKIPLKSFDCEVDTAENGFNAIDVVKNKKYDLILMDIGLPDIDGISVAQEIRNLNNKITSIFLSSL